MPAQEIRKKKACVNCTHAKAKCSPSVQCENTCERCRRMGKSCVYLETSRTRGKPRTRSRVEQLEQRIEGLMTLLVGDALPRASTSTSPASATIPSTARALTKDPGSSSTTSTLGASRTPESGDKLLEEGDPNDIIQRGLLSYEQAAYLLNTYRSSCVNYFPFVAVTPDATIDSLRHEQPFLFLSIMTSMSYANTERQRLLSEEFNSQVASRIIVQSQRSLELLQGLLVYVAWYHYLFKSHSQQLGVMLQLCTALVHDLGLSKPPTKRRFAPHGLKDHFCMPLDKEVPVMTLAARRATLGTYFLLSAYAHAFRKQAYMKYTKYMGRICETLAEANELPTDRLIKPLLQIHELLSRVNDYYSYDDIENSEVHGCMVIEASTRSFLQELDQIKSSIPASVKENVFLKAQLHFLQAWVNEPSLHNDLWKTPDDPNPFGCFRSKMLYDALSSAKAYLELLSGCPSQSLFNFPFPAWAGWSYVSIVICRIIFVKEDTLKDGQRQNGHEPSSSGAGADLPIWDPISAEKAAGISRLFRVLLDKLTSVSSDGVDSHGNRDGLYYLTILQCSMLTAYERRLKELTSSSSVVPEASIASNPPQPDVLSLDGASAPDPMSLWQSVGGLDPGYIPDMPGTTLEASQQNAFQDIVWDMMMYDFTMPQM